MKYSQHHLTTCKPATPSTWPDRRKRPTRRHWRNLFTKRWGRSGRALKAYRKRGRR